MIALFESEASDDLFNTYSIVDYPYRKNQCIVNEFCYTTAYFIRQKNGLTGFILRILCQPPYLSSNIIDIGKPC